MPSSPTAAPTEPLLRLSIAVFLCYLTIGLPLPVLPLYVHHRLGFGNFLVGATIGVQFLATVLTRRYAGSICDRLGASVSMLRGFWFCELAGIAYLLAAALRGPAAGTLLILLLGRLLLGVGESLLITGCMTWGIALAGPERAGRVITWTGMAMYGAMAVGAPLGLALYGWHQFEAVAVGVALLPLFARLWVIGVPAVADHAVGGLQPFSTMVRTVLRPGTALFLQGVGFAAIGAFVSLDFDARHWQRAGLALTLFGLAFVLMRLVGGSWPDRIGGYPVALGSFVLEIVGQLLLWRAAAPAVALAGAAITGLGCSLMYPALGVEVVRRVDARTRGTALGAYAAFQDVAYGATGPAAGLIVGSLGYQAAFALGLGAALLGAGLVMPWKSKE